MFFKRINILLLDFYAEDSYTMAKMKHKGENTITI
jgi:hypothetical protein